MNLMEFKKLITNKINHLICNNPDMATEVGKGAETYNFTRQTLRKKWDETQEKASNAKLK